MTALSATTPLETHRPTLSGRWVSAYRLTWAALALVAGAVMAASIYGGTAHPAVLALRLAKAAVIISVCVILLRRRANDTVAALLSLAFLTWTITSSFDFASAELLPRLLDRVRFLLFVLALLLFPDARWRPRWTRNVAFASVAIFLLGAAEGLGFVPTRLFLPLAISCVIAAIAALILRFRTAATQSEKQQFKWVALGLFSGVGLILVARVGAALSAGHAMLAASPVLFEGLFQLGIILVALGFLVSLLRYRLFDAEAAITRSAAYAGLTLALVGTFAGSEALIEMLGQQYLGMGVGNVSAAMAAAVAAVLLAPLHERISAWAEHHFERDLALLKHELPELLADFPAGSSARRLATVVLPRICIAIHVSRAALVVDNAVLAATGLQPRQVRAWFGRAAISAKDHLALREPADALFPVRMVMCCSSGSVRGWLLLGPRPDGSLPGKHEFAALESVVPALRQALLATKDREDAQKRERRRFRAMNRRIDELSRRVDVLYPVAQAA